MAVKLRRQLDIGLWVISNEVMTLCVLDDGDLKSLSEQFKEAGF